ncbi:GntR family transcriptional regulator [Mesorhizobium sp. L-8-10]|uniref:GntR family transcriptional regulator n=1 Tax=unclassified Mesorhizobium TaxID=325217 RepID=UPI0019296CD8|nr:MULTISPECIES: GntR family transcriptional regulator [unclassified Mesorhizobium]BCH22826.1 GntR family transcriptional regulator [Mesorhizobium sp. L-8-3]BCH30631.1 GntR family transcriptional regulator [Mesorhizobium sp. L-8-10]
MSSRSKVVADILTRAIIEHRLVPGCKLGERELAEIFDVSRIVIRQALIRIAEDGLVQMERNRGAFVAKPGIQEALEIYDALTLVEQGVAAQLSDRLGPAGWAELRQHVERQRQAVAAGNNPLADVLGQEFHTVFVRLSRNKVMQEIHAQLLRRTTLLRSLITADFDYCNLLDDHARVIDLLEKGRLKQAMELIESHHRTVVRGYIMDRQVFPELTPREALGPYLEGRTAELPKPAPGKKTGDNDGASVHSHVHASK